MLNEDHAELYRPFILILALLETIKVVFDSFHNKVAVIFLIMDMQGLGSNVNEKGIALGRIHL